VETESSQGIEPFVDKLKTWCQQQADIEAVGIVGSWARGTARPESDIDVMLITSNPSKYLSSWQWLSEFGVTHKIQPEDWGLVQSLRTFYKDAREVEFCITTEQWASPAEIDSGTAHVVRDGMRIVFDPNGLLANLMAVVKHSEKTT
jgi:hypothetical protein